MTRPTLKLGSTGPDVSAWQTVVGVAADGRFGPATERATKQWQRDHGLDDDGVVGPATWAAAGSPSGLPDIPEGRILGIDTSASQGLVDWPAVMAEGVSFAFIKATDGIFSVDARWEDNSAGARSAGLLFGSYHALEPSSDPTAQAQHYTTVAKGIGGLPPVLDFELAKGLPAASALARAVTFLDAVEAAWGRRALVYTGPAFIDQLAKLAGSAANGPLDALSQRPLWIAHYDVPRPSIPRPWSDWTIWQFKGDGGYRMPNGVVVDVDWFRGNVNELRAL